MNTEKIITTQDHERWPLLEMPSHVVAFPLNDTDAGQIQMMDTLLDELDEQAAGLAAIQIGYPKQMFLLRNGPKDSNNKPTNKVYINPKIIDKSHAQKMNQEACLSVPGFTVRCKRPKELTLEFQDMDGVVQREKFINFWSRAVSHEMAHLNGVTVINEFEKQLANKPLRNKIGMRIDPITIKKLKIRREKSRLAKKARKQNRK